MSYIEVPSRRKFLARAGALGSTRAVPQLSAAAGLSCRSRHETTRSTERPELCARVGGLGGQAGLVGSVGTSTIRVASSFRASVDASLMASSMALTVAAAEVLRAWATAFFDALKSERGAV